MAHFSPGVNTKSLGTPKSPVRCRNYKDYLSESAVNRECSARKIVSRGRERAGRVYYGAVFPRSKEEIPNKSSAFWLGDDAFNEILCSMVIEDSHERKECAMQDHGDMSTARSLDSEIHGVSVVSGARGSGAARNGSSGRMVVRPAEPGGGGTLTWRMKVFQFCSRAT
jgi:hypothetical protein